ncbi:hypothetical protein DMUE_6118, partial [Dictyocoela muelleri]
RIKKLCDKYNEKINKKKKYNFKINEMVLIKNYASDKMSSAWIGPFKVSYISKSGNNLIVDKENKKIRVSVKGCRPFVEVEDVVLNTTKFSECSVTFNEFINYISLQFFPPTKTIKEIIF